MFQSLRTDFQVIFDRDPAARNWLEVLLCYPGLHAIWLYRLAHLLYSWHIPVIPRLISQFARLFTGVEIHPGAVIGSGAFIDHGMGVVIGETTIIGKNVVLYQGVTLGGTGKEVGKRHPTLGDNVVVGAGAKILGNIEVGSGSRIGAGSVLLKSVPPGSTVVGIPGRVVQRKSENSPLDHNRLPDPEGDVIRALVQRVEYLEQEARERRGLAEVIEDPVLNAVRPKHLKNHRGEHQEGFSGGAGI